MIEEYCTRHTSQPDEVLREVYRSIQLHTANPHMSSTPEQGAFLQMLSQMICPHLIVELGVFGAYSTICLARGLAEGGILHAVEAEEEYEPMIRRHLEMGGVGEKVQLHIGAALDVVDSLPNDIDLVFVDADKLNYTNYYEKLLPKMRPGGWMLFDNMLWYGKVLDVTEHTTLRADREARELASLNDYIQQDSRVENLLLPMRDGLMAVRVR